MKQVRFQKASILFFCALASLGVVRTQAEECVRHVVHVFEGNPNPRLAFGYHGTSLQSLKLAMETGVLKPSLTPGLEKEIYFFGNPLHPKIKELSQRGTIQFTPRAFHWDTTDSRAAFKGAQGYALDRSRASRLLEYLRLPVTPETKYLADDFTSIGTALPEIRRGFARFHVTDRELKPALEYAGKGRGVVLLLSEEVTEHFKVSNAPNKEPGLRLEAPDGLPLRFIAGIEAMGDEEYQFLLDLQKASAEAN